MRKQKITLKRSLIEKSKKTKRIIRSLGLRKIGQTVIHKDVPAIRGQVEKVRRYVEVEEIEG